jgi:hypothetical protein
MTPSPDVLLARKNKMGRSTPRIHELVALRLDKPSFIFKALLVLKKGICHKLKMRF